MGGVGKNQKKVHARENSKKKDLPVSAKIILHIQNILGALPQALLYYY